MVMVLICSMPGCQTTAGCRCNRYEALYAKAAADVAYSSEIAKRDAEITRLTAELSALRASTKEERVKALEEAAKVAEGPADAWGEFVGGTPERDKIAASIRALMVKP